MGLDAPEEGEGSHWELGRQPVFLGMGRDGWILTGLILFAVLLTYLIYRVESPRTPLVYRLLAPADFVQAPRIDAGFATIVGAGLLVGLGTRYGSGCTSGHGVCGLSRLSPRSLVATLAFMGAGFAMVFVVRHVL